MLHVSTFQYRNTECICLLKYSEIAKYFSFHNIDFLIYFLNDMYTIYFTSPPVTACAEWFR